MGEFGRSGPKLPHDEAAQREHLNEVEDDFRRNQMIASTRGFVNELVGLDRLRGHSSDGVLDDVALSLHRQMLRPE
jgi:hypothetical protein